MFLKLSENHGTYHQLINMDHVKRVRINGNGGSKLYYSDRDPLEVKESVEQIENMLYEYEKAQLYKGEDK